MLQNFNHIKASSGWPLLASGLCACTCFYLYGYNAELPRELLMPPSPEAPGWLRWLPSFWAQAFAITRHALQLATPAMSIIIWAGIVNWCRQLPYDPSRNDSVLALVSWFLHHMAARPFDDWRSIGWKITIFVAGALAVVSALPILWAPYSLLLYTSIPFSQFAKCNVVQAEAAFASAQHLASQLWNASMLPFPAAFAIENTIHPGIPAWSVLSYFPAPDVLSIDTAMQQLAAEKSQYGHEAVTTAEGHMLFTYMQTAAAMALFVASQMAEMPLYDLLSCTRVEERFLEKVRNSQERHLYEFFVSFVRVGTQAVVAGAVFLSVWNILATVQLCVLVVTQLPCHHSVFHFMAVVSLLLSASLVLGTAHYILTLASGIYYLSSISAQQAMSRHMSALLSLCEHVEIMNLQKLAPGGAAVPVQEVSGELRNFAVRRQIVDATPWLDRFAGECEERHRKYSLQQLVDSAFSYNRAMNRCMNVCTLALGACLLLGCGIYAYCLAQRCYMAIYSILVRWVESRPDWSMYVIAATFRNQFDQLQYAALPPAPVVWDVQQHFVDMAKGVHHVLSCMTEVTANWFFPPPLSALEYTGIILLLSAGYACTFTLLLVTIVPCALFVVYMCVRPLVELTRTSSEGETLIAAALQADVNTMAQCVRSFCLYVQDVTHSDKPEEVCASVDFVSVGALFLELIDNTPGVDHKTCDLMLERLHLPRYNGIIFPSSLLALSWLLLKRGLGGTRILENWHGLTPSMMVSALPPSAIKCNRDFEGRLPVMPRVLKCAQVGEMSTFRLNDQHMRQIYGHEEDPTPWAQNIDAWHTWPDNEWDGGASIFCFLPLAKYVSSLPYTFDEYGNTSETLDKTEIEHMCEALRSGLDRLVRCFQHEDAMQRLIDEMNARKQTHRQLQEDADNGDTEADAELQRHILIEHLMSNLLRSFTTWWRVARPTPDWLRLQCLITRFPLAQRAARWHARKAAVLAWVCINSSEFP